MQAPVCRSRLKTRSSLGQSLHAQLTLRELHELSSGAGEAIDLLRQVCRGALTRWHLMLLRTSVLPSGERVKDELADNQTQDGITCMTAEQIRATYVPSRHTRLLRC